MTDSHSHHILTSDEISIIVDKAVKNTLTTLGIDLSSTADVRAVQADFGYMRKQRLGAEEVGRYAKKAFVSTAIAGLLFALVQGIRLAFSMKGL